MLSLHAVNHYYGDQHTLWDIDLELAPGLCTSLVGLPGMGKTTLVNCITGYLPVESGSMIWQDAGAPPRDLLTLQAEHRSAVGIGYVPQDRRIFSQLTVEENLHVAMRAAGDAGQSLSREIFDLFPELYGLRQQRGATLSEDNQQQLSMARALVTRPRLLILDEPTRGIDVGAHAEIIRLIETLCADGLALLVISSELEELVGYADRVIIMRDRKQVAEIPLAELSVPAIMNAIAA